MLKLTFCLRRLPSLTVAQFRTYWLDSHGPLVRRHAPAMRIARYVQVHALDEPNAAGAAAARGAPEPFDGTAEVWWASDEDFRFAMADRDARRAGRILLEDEKTFIDLARSPIWLGREHVFVPAGGPG